MTGLWARLGLGRHLLLRLYLYQVLIIVVGLAAFQVLKQTVLDSQDELALGGLAFVGARALRESDQPERLQAELQNVRARIPLSIALYSRDGSLLFADGAQPEPRLGPEAVARLEHSGELKLASHAIAVARRDPAGRVQAYALVSIPPQSLVSRRLSMAVVLLLVGFALGSVPIAHSISRPVRRLAQAASALGAGDLSARSGLTRNDELGDLSRAFDQMADRIEVLRRSERELLASVSHELRTPLSRIRVVLELAAEEFPDLARRHTAEIAADLNELEILIDDIIRAAQLASGVQSSNPYPPLARSALEVEGFVKSIAQRFVDQHPDRPLTCGISCEVGLSLPADRILLKRALENLLENAHKYSLPGRSIDLRAAQPAGQDAVTITVQDEGVGIDATDLPHVFTPFFRGDRSRARKTGGTGLGLTLAQRIVQAHGGTIRLESEPDRGTTVTISLPLEPPAVATAASACS
jgi:two-component system OmpR family sensor kinase